MLEIFVLSAAVGLVLSAMVFIFKDILHAALALAGIFAINSLIFITLNQPLLAVVQLFIMVGGIATFIFVGVATAQYPEFKYTKLAWLGVAWILLFVAMAFPLGTSWYSTGQLMNEFGASDIASSISTNAGFYYIMLLLMFGVALGGILLLKKIGVGRSTASLSVKK